MFDSNSYRYWKAGETNGYAGGLKYSFSADSYRRLITAYSDPATATDSQVAPYADQYFEYDSAQRVTKATIQGLGCSSCSGGLGTSTYAYTTSSFADGLNNWRTKTVETLPDGNQNIVFTNYAGEVMLFVYKETATGHTWETFSEYDSVGRLILKARPSAVSGYDETTPDLLSNQLGNYQYLNDSTGLVETISYGSSTSATSSSAGNVSGYQYQTSLQQGETGTAVLQSTQQYFSRSGNGTTIYPIANVTQYRSSGGSDGQTTSASYTWQGTTALPQTVTVTYPTVTTTQNGPNTADTETYSFDSYGRPVWSKNADGFIDYTAYDQATGAVIKVIVDVNTANTSDFTGLPSGWSMSPGASKPATNGRFKTSRDTDVHNSLRATDSIHRGRHSEQREASRGSRGRQ